MKRLFFALVIMLSSACSTNTKQPAQHDFGLSASASSQILSKPDLSITTPQWLWNKCIHYRLLYSSPTQLRCYSLDQWIAPPPELFKQLLASKIITKHRLMVELSEFEQQFDSSNIARVLINMRVNVYAPQSEKLIATQNFHLEQVSNTPNAAGAVSGFANLTRLATEKVQHWLSGLAN